MLTNFDLSQVRCVFRIALAMEIKDPRPRRVESESAPMTRKVKRSSNDATSSLALNEAQSPYKAGVWRRLTPRERLRRSWQMRSRVPDLKAVHDRKLFPKP